MEIHDARCDTSAMLDATVVSLPYALGITIVLRPRGMAREQIAQITKVSYSLGRGKIAKIPMKISGKIASRTTVTAHTPTFVNTFFRLIAATVMPVSSIAIGDIQFPAVVITEIDHSGKGIAQNPITIPITMQTNIGFTNAFAF